MNTTPQTVICSGEHIILTHTEYRILELLITHRKKIFSIDQIFNNVLEEEAVGDNAVMVHMKKLRKK
ncbi:winged helix-turn-helix domain-containing protein [Cellulosilyticum ruminicola]|uniref:winged helix-turn-helix domain-containing protein n=1 Tax=Cellulosilyticum ruminicola TaxID=425254 RepID=UPI00278C3B32|nr:winged helix-turn-helix domain-containing protein [Cellulosilyticum ruminicola]